MSLTGGVMSLLGIVFYLSYVIYAVVSFRVFFKRWPLWIQVLLNKVHARLERWTIHSAGCPTAIGSHARQLCQNCGTTLAYQPVTPGLTFKGFPEGERVAMTSSKIVLMIEGQEIRNSQPCGTPVT